ncbi:hypothetical protein HMPREF1860_01881 [Prevotella amnii]|uniref:Rad52/22 family double-strand break repair protein n=1 Tax=Prevotella amnii TaxID=419005 RepID=A0A134B5A8_9BACT|nr:Rad52/Rad22 family DNA repair protein [Prevotella amnii]KXB75138.1 hypothetical protein HMPREF1860_01881 [Prevotella amnii]
MGCRKLNFRTLHADEIECRVGSVSEGKGCSLLMYKNARVDMTLLDEVVGPENWQRSHEVINDNLFCKVSVRSESGEWVSKQDVGTESNTEKEKGQASDAFKRACVNWGIGRELYTCPFVWVTLRTDEWKTGFNGKKQPKTRFYVSAIEYDEQRRVSYLSVVDDKGVQRYTFGHSRALDEERQKAIEAIKNAKTREEIVQVYNTHKSLHNDQALIEACTERTKQIKAA